MSRRINGWPITQKKVGKTIPIPKNAKTITQVPVFFKEKHCLIYNIWLSSAATFGEENFDVCIIIIYITKCLGSAMLLRFN